MFNLPRSCRAVHSGNTILHSQQRGTRGPAAPYSRQPLLWSDFSASSILLQPYLTALVARTSPALLGRLHVSFQQRANANIHRAVRQTPTGACHGPGPGLGAENKTMTRTDWEN